MLKDNAISNDKTQVERRQFPRLNATVDVDYRILKKEPMLRKRSVTRNISALGICLIVYQKLEVGTDLALKIHFTDIDAVIEARGKVVWRSEFVISSDKRERYDTGIEFVDIKEEEQKRIAQYVFRLVK